MSGHGGANEMGGTEQERQRLLLEENKMTEREELEYIKSLTPSQLESYNLFKRLKLAEFEARAKDKELEIAKLNASK